MADDKILTYKRKCNDRLAECFRHQQLKGD